MIAGILIACLWSWPAFAEDWVIVRHGLSLKNVHRIQNGEARNSSKYPLVEEGEQQVYATAEALKAEGVNDSNVAMVYVSPFLRTRQTAQILLEVLDIDPIKVRIDDRLSEVGVGDLEEVPHEEAEKYLGPEREDISRAKEYHGETYTHLKKRLRSFLADVKARHHQGYVFAITHGTPARHLMDMLDPQNPRKSQPRTAEFNIIRRK